MRTIKADDLRKDFFEYKEIEEVTSVREIIKDIRINGDEALKRYTRRFDGVECNQFKIEYSEIKDSYQQVDQSVQSAIKQATSNIKKFATEQLKQFKDFQSEITSGVLAGQKVVPIERVGVYVPGGQYPLISTLLMCAVPAQVAGVEEIAVCSPPTFNKKIHPAILIAADIIGVDEIYMIGGAQAIGALAYGTETVKRVDKIVGPGNKYVAFAKKEVYGAVGIDFIAGPTEIMIIADESARANIIAADLLSQAEHDIEAIPVLITTSQKLADEVKKEVDQQIEMLITKDIARTSIAENGIIIIAHNIKEAIEIADRRAPEHLELHLSNSDDYIDRFKNYGTLFIGRYTSEVLGDYICGINHTLPTNTAARYTGGLSIKDFLKIQTTLKVTKDGLKSIAPSTKIFADIEGLDGHAKSIEKRIDND